MRPSVLCPVLAAAILAAAAAPALAVSIKHTSRVEGDPTPPPPVGHAAPPPDTSGMHYFDKAHESGTRG